MSLQLPDVDLASVALTEIALHKFCFSSACDSVTTFASMLVQHAAIQSSAQCRVAMAIILGVLPLQGLTTMQHAAASNAQQWPV